MTLRDDLFDAQARRANLFDRYGLGERMATTMMTRAKLIVGVSLMVLGTLLALVKVSHHA